MCIATNIVFSHHDNAHNLNESDTTVILSPLITLKIIIFSPSRLFQLRSLLRHVIMWNAAPKHVGMSKKYSRVPPALFSTRTTKKCPKTRTNLNRCFEDFRGSIGDLRDLISMTATPLLVQCQGIGDFLCFQQADKR